MCERAIVSMVGTTPQEFRDNYMGGKVQLSHKQQNTMASNVLQDGSTFVSPVSQTVHQNFTGIHF